MSDIIFVRKHRVAVQPFSLEYVAGSFASDASNLTTYTFNSVPFGAAEANRILIVAFMYNRIGGQGTHSCTIAGNATTVVQANGTNVSTSLCYTKIPSGTSGTVVVSSDAGTGLAASIAVFRLVGQTSDTPFHSHAPAGGGDSSRAVTINLPTNGGACISAGGDNGNPSGNWTNATGQWAEVVEAAGHSGGLYLGGPQTGRVITHSDCRAICGLSWG